MKNQELLSVTNSGKVELPAKYLTSEVSNEERNRAIEFIKNKNTEIFFTGKRSGNEIKKSKAKDINNALIFLLEKANKGIFRHLKN